VPVLHKRFRADHLEEAYEAKHGRAPAGGLADVNCPHCGNKGGFTEPRQFSGLLKTYLGPVENDEGLHYLRPETAQGIFVNFLNVMQSARKKPPFGIAQTGKSFRNEITPGQLHLPHARVRADGDGVLRRAGTDVEWHEYWLQERWNWYVGLGLRPENLRNYEHPQEKLSHYSKRTVDIEYRFRFGGSEFAELEGIANRTDFDLSTHSKHSGADLTYFDQDKGERWTPYVIEPAAGLTERKLAFMLDAYAEARRPTPRASWRRARSCARPAPRRRVQDRRSPRLSRNARPLAEGALTLPRRAARVVERRVDDAERFGDGTVARTRSVRRSA
jgi:glycyl-tRNA synthetase